LDHLADLAGCERHGEPAEENAGARAGREIDPQLPEIHLPLAEPPAVVPDGQDEDRADQPPIEMPKGVGKIPRVAEQGEGGNHGDADQESWQERAAQWVTNGPVIRGCLRVAGRRRHGQSFSRGSKASRSPFPARLMVKAVRKIKKPGKKTLVQF